MEETMNSASVWISSLAAAAAGGWFAATMFAQPATSEEPRFPQLTMDQLDEKQKPLSEQIIKVFQRRPWRGVQSDYYAPGAGSAVGRPVLLSALGNFGPDQAQ